MSERPAEDEGETADAVVARPAAYTLADVARRAKVSESTVSRVLRNKLPIAEATRSNVLAAVREMGYFPNRVAGTLASSGSNLVGVVLASLSNIVFPDVLSGINAALGASGYQPVVGVSDYDHAEEERLVAALLSWKPAAMLVSGLDHSAATTAMLRRAGIRIVEMMDIDETPIDIAVGLSHRQAGRDTAAHLLQRGYRRFGHVGHVRDRRAALRYAGLRAELAAAGLDLVDEEIGEGPTSVRSGRLCLEALLARKRGVDVVVFSNDDLAVGGVFHCLGAGIRPKEDVGLFGFNALDVGQELPLPLSTIRSHRFLIGRLAVERMLESRVRPPMPTIVDTGYEIVTGATA